MTQLLQKLVAKLHKRWIRYDTERFLQRRQRLKNLIAEFDRESASVGLSPYKYVSLYRMVRRTRPAYVLECGTGKSTFVIPQAMSENGNGRKLVSLEESGEWAAEQNKAIDHFFSHSSAPDWFPGADRHLIELIHSDTVADRHRSWAGNRYADCRDYPYDFILVDGPALTDEFFINLDLVHVLKHFSESASIWIDGRWAVSGMCRVLFGEKAVRRPGWSHTEVYGATRADLDRDLGAINRELTKLLR